MLLQKFLEYENIAIQCHNIPDADAIASGFALYSYIKAQKKTPLFFYKGEMITKPNLLAMLMELQIPLTHEPDVDTWDGLLITVDCQYGMRNVTKIEAKAVAVIDHHIQEKELPEMCELRPWLGSCSTLIWDLLSQTAFTIDKRLSTALFYGLFMDTNCFSELKHPLDKDMWDALSAEIDKDIFKKMRLSNLSWNDLLQTSSSLKDLIKVHDELPVVLIPVSTCDPNLLGVIADLVIQVDGVDSVVAFTHLESKDWKLSVRTSTHDTTACHLADWITQGIGSGGGHKEKAGGYVAHQKYTARFSDKAFETYCTERLCEYYKSHRIIDCLKPASMEDWPDMTRCQTYRKLSIVQAYVATKEVFGEGITLQVRTLEGEIPVKTDANNYLMLGIQGEVYPIKRDTFESTYKVEELLYTPSGNYLPTVLNTNTGMRTPLLQYAQPCKSKTTKKIQAFCLQESEYIKIFTQWDRENYYSGKPKDFVVVQASDDVYVVQADIFAQVYARDFTEEHIEHLPEAQCVFEKTAQGRLACGWALQPKQIFCVEKHAAAQAHTNQESADEKACAENALVLGNHEDWLVQNKQGVFEIMSDTAFQQKYLVETSA